MYNCFSQSVQEVKVHSHFSQFVPEVKVYSHFSQVNAGSENLQLFLSVNIGSESYNHFSQTKLIKNFKTKTGSQEKWMVKSQPVISEEVMGWGGIGPFQL